MGKAERPGFDMDHLEKMLGEQLPFMPKGMLKNRMGMNGAWIGEYVQDVLKRTFADGEAGKASTKGFEENEENDGRQAEGITYDYELFETHNSVIVRVRIPEDVHYKNVKAYAGSNQLKLEQEPSRKKQYVKLPCVVDAGQTKAVYKDRVLEIRMPKMDEAEVFQEIRIRYQS